MNQPFVEKQDQLNAFHPGQQSTRFPNAPTGLVYPGDAGVPRGTYPTDKNNIAPRLAAVWDVRGDGRTSGARAWGLFYDTLPGQGDFFQNGTLAPPFQPLTEVNYPLNVTTLAVRQPAGGRHRHARLPARADLHRLGDRLRDAGRPALQPHAAAAAGRELGTRGRATSARAARTCRSSWRSTRRCRSCRRRRRSGRAIFPAFSLVRPTFSEAKSWYDSLQASARMRPWHGLNLLASYTLAHAVDHVSGLNIGGEPRPMLPVTIGDEASIDAALAREKGDALFDARHRFVLSFGYELPRLTDRGTATRLVLGGWQANGIIQGQTGFPLTVIEPNNVSLTSQTNRPNMTCDPNEGGAAHDRAVVQHLLLPAPDAGGERRPGRQRSAQRRPRPGLHPHRPVGVQELRRAAASRCSCASRSSTCSTRSASASRATARRGDFRRDHRGGRRPDRAARDQVHVLRTGRGLVGQVGRAGQVGEPAISSKQRSRARDYASIVERSPIAIKRPSAEATPMPPPAPPALPAPRAPRALDERP